MSPKVADPAVGDPVYHREHGWGEVVAADAETVTVRYRRRRLVHALAALGPRSTQGFGLVLVWEVRGADGGR